MNVPSRKLANGPWRSDSTDRKMLPDRHPKRPVAPTCSRELSGRDVLRHVAMQGSPIALLQRLQHQRCTKHQKRALRSTKFSNHYTQRQNASPLPCSVNPPQGAVGGFAPPSSDDCPSNCPVKTYYRPSSLQSTRHSPAWIESLISPPMHHLLRTTPNIWNFLTQERLLPPLDLP